MEDQLQGQEHLDQSPKVFQERQQCNPVAWPTNPQSTQSCWSATSSTSVRRAETDG